MMTARRPKATGSRSKKGRLTVAKHGTNFQPHEEAAKQTLRKSPYYRLAAGVDRASGTPTRRSRN